ncbi:hypothetical protein KSP39_PZI014851 [Platanthera zijinensis]|uniref:Uncharacterized protein n=1 Tax=Platanthera zijinensis TaxID=2320716 RepID=A0AAP0BBW4_9ASPA
MASILLLSPYAPSLSSPLIPNLAGNSHRLAGSLHCVSGRRLAAVGARFLVISFALAEPNTSDSLGEEEPIIPSLEELSGCFDIPPDYLSKLPRDLRLDLNDAAFDLANGSVLDECGQEVGEFFINLSRAWEQADTLTSNRIAAGLPSLHGYLTTIGRRLLLAGRRFEAMGQYGQGELSRIAKAMIKTGNLLSKDSVLQTDGRTKSNTRTFKFGELQVALTTEKANIGAVIAFVLGFLSWELSQGIQNNPESSFQYANDNALMLAKSLRGFLLVISYGLTVLSAFASVGLLLLGQQLNSENKSE